MSHMPYVRGTLPLPEPTKQQRYEMERYRTAFPCLIDEHKFCGGVYVHDRWKSPDDWQPCTCPCHRGQHAKRGRVIMRPPIGPLK